MDVIVCLFVYILFGDELLRNNTTLPSNRLIKVLSSFHSTTESHELEKLMTSAKILATRPDNTQESAQTILHIKPLSQNSTRNNES